MERIMLLTMSLGLFMACQSEVDTKQAAEVKEVKKQEKQVNRPSPLTKKKLVKIPAPGTKIAPTDLVANAFPMVKDSKIEFSGAKVTGDHKGGFEKVKGSVMVDDAGKVSSVNLIIDMTSVYADPFPYAEKFVSHLKDEDFFHVEKYPIASFKSTSIQDGKITGIFEMRGVQKEITFNATFTDAPPYDLKAEFKVNRKLWGIEYAGKADNLIKDDVAILANLQFSK